MKVVEKSYGVRLPAWLGRPVLWLMTRLGGKLTKRRTLAGEEVGVTKTFVFGGTAEERNLVAGEAGTRFQSETEELR